MKTVRYEAQPKGTGSTENQVAVDRPMTAKFGTMERAYEEGFAASQGVRPGTAENDGAQHHPESRDSSHPDRVPSTIEQENSGLADS